jgi:hypothetical protein
VHLLGFWVMCRALHTLSAPLPAPFPHAHFARARAPSLPSHLRALTIALQSWANSRALSFWPRAMSNQLSYRCKHCAVLEEICALRRKLGLVITVYVPGHRGMVPNEYVDAVAKAFTHDAVDENIARRVAKSVRTRPCIYVEGEAQGLCMRTVYAAALRGVQRWAVAQLRPKAANGMLAGIEGKVWDEVVTHTGHARAPKRRKEEDDAHDEPEIYRRLVRHTYTVTDGDGGACGIASGYRIGRHALAEHSCTWQQHLRCAGGCGERADLQHVAMGRCRVAVGRDVYVQKLHECLDAIVKRLPQAAKPTRTAPMREWQCPAKMQILHARRGIRTDITKPVIPEDWQALRATIAGIIPRPIALGSMKQRERKHAEGRVSEAISELQRLVHAAMIGRWDTMGEARRADDAERAQDALWCKAVQEAEAKEAARQARMHEETMQAAASMRAARAAQRTGEVEADRRATARGGDAVAHTRDMRGRLTATNPTACERNCDERARMAVCTFCAAHIHSTCAMRAKMGRKARPGARHATDCKNVSECAKRVCTPYGRRARAA